MRKTIVAGNWKMNKNKAEIIEFVNKIKEENKATESEAIICAPFVYLPLLVELTKDTYLKVGAQNMHFEEKGAYTGEVSGEMLKDIGVEYVIIGHSERRQYFNETDETVNKKVIKALSINLKPIVCIGETEQQWENNETQTVVGEQVEKALINISAEQAEKIIFAYEPIWAIGTGKVATSEDANKVIKFIRSTVEKLYNKETAEKIHIQYGGSVKPNNIKELLEQSDIDGALVGGASVKAEDFIQLI